MKKLIVISLVLAMVMAMCGCGEKATTQTTATEGATTATDVVAPTTETPTEQDAVVNIADVPGIEGKFSVGYARIDITPQTSVPMAGFGRTSQRMTRVVRDNLYATSVAMRDEEGTVVIFLSMDLQRASNITVDAIRPVVSERTGIPMDHIMLHGTHTHSGPDLNNTKEPLLAAYIEYLNPRLEQVIYESIADLKPAEISYGSIETIGLNFVKHYQHTTADGEVKYFGDNFGTQVLDSTTKHVTDADPTMHMLQITREGEKDIVMVNWRTHPTLTGGSTKYDLSADLVGTFRLALESQIDCEFIYFTGASGNINAKSRITAEMAALDVDHHGALMAADAIECLKNMKKTETTKLQTKQIVLDMETNHTTDELLVYAKQVNAMWSQGATFAECAAFGEPWGIRSPYYAGSIISRATRPETMDVELNTITIGDEIAICTAPNELFDTNSVYVEEHSPYAMTMTFGYSNGYRGYIPSAFGWEYTCYESDCCYFLPGCGEQIQDTFLSMLDSLAA